MVPGQIPMQSATGQDMKAQAIGQAGQVIKQTGNLILELKAEQERQAFSDAELDLRRASKELAGKLASNPNPQDHLKDAQEFYDGVTASILSKGGYSPRFEKEMTKRIGMFTESKMAEIATDAKLMQLESGRRKHDALVKSYIEDKKFDEASVLLDEGNGIYRGQDDTDIAKMGVERMRRDDQMRTEVQYGNAEYFENKDLPIAESDRLRYKAQAESQRAMMESNDVGKIGGLIEIDEITTREGLQEAIDKAQNISPQTAKLMLKNWDNSKPLTPDEERNLLYRMDNMHEGLKKGQISLDEYRTEYYTLQSEISALGNRAAAGGVRSRISDLNPDGWSPGNLTSKKAEGGSAKFVRTLSAKFDTGGGFGGKTIDGEDATPIDMMDAALARELTETAMMSWLESEEGKNASESEIKDRFIKEAASAMSEVDVEDINTNNYTSDELEAITGPSGSENFTDFGVPDTVPGTLLPTNNTMPGRSEFE